MPGINMPDEWPGKDLSDILPWYVNQLKSDPELYGWGIWIAIDASSKEVVGDMGFKGKPDRGSVEIGYSVVPAHRRHGYGFEAARAIVEWAFSHKDVDVIKAECEKDNTASIHLLEKLGMHRLAEDGDLLKWEIRKAMCHSETIS
jgi:ribosomal-protein-alanine N-acetyltransferase